ncbi:MAG: glycosyltransferase family 2 protein [Bacteroidales bacterium]|nr:glycosyltransferase family 2 protein [Bacteroidales bacterium]
MKISVIVSTYNWPEALELSLKSLLAQTRLPDEIIVGDDGSGHETAAVIAEIQSYSPVRIIHVWQEDKGFRLAEIRNKAVLASSGDYIIQIDGDIFVHPRFVEDHESFAKPGFYLRGGRVMLDKKLTETLCRTRVPRIIKVWNRGIESKRPNTLRIKWLADILVSRYRPNSWVLGCNMSYYRSDFDSVNGYDESFVGWGGEDSDFFRRLRLNGVYNRRLKFAGLTYHLWHRQNVNPDLKKNDDYSMRPNPVIYCVNGAVK